MQLRYGLLLAANCAWAAATGFNYQVADPSAVIGAMAVDAAGNTYLTGATHSSTFPTTPGVFQPHFDGAAGRAWPVLPELWVDPGGHSEL